MIPQQQRSSRKSCLLLSDDLVPVGVATAALAAENLGDEGPGHVERGVALRVALVSRRGPTVALQARRASAVRKIPSSFMKVAMTGASTCEIDGTTR